MALLLMFAYSAPANEIGYNERFALAEDREAVLKELIPGTEEYYYYNALQHQHEARFDEAKKLMDAGIKKYGHSGMMRELENRHALLTYEQNPDSSIDYIRRYLNLHFNHQQRQLNPEVRLPTKLDQDRISFDAFLRHAFAEQRHTGRFEDSAFDFLVTANLNPDQRRHLLGRLQRPDYPGIVKMVIDDLAYRHSQGWGHHQIHGMLTLAQMDACLELDPKLINNTNFINTYLRKLRPSDDVDWEADDEEHLAYLERLMAFADKLPPAQNSLKANVLYQRLHFDWKQGTYDRGLFEQYIKLPRPVHYINPKWLDRGEFRDSRVNMHASYQALTALPPIGGDEPMVRDFLMYFLKDAKDFSAYDEYVEHNYLKRLFAEVKLVNGIGDAEQWYAMMRPEEVKALRDRIDLQLLHTNPDQLPLGSEVSLDVAVKNIEKLKIMVYEINTTGFYRQNLEQITTAIDLDGLVANRESEKSYSQPPMRRHVEKLTFPDITKPGVYIAELVGNGVSSRAVLRLGNLRYTERMGAAGHVFQIFDDERKLARDAVIWIDGREFKADDESGEIVVPFSGKPGQQSFVISRGDFSVLAQFDHSAENYEFRAGIHMAREQLVAGKQCTVAIRPELLLNGEPVDLSLIEQPVLTIRSADIDGHSSEKQVNDFKLRNDGESTYEFRVPERLRSVTVVLSGMVQNLSTGKKEPVFATRTVTLNGIYETDKTEDLVLRYTSDGFIVEDIGRNAEARGGRAVHYQFKHRDFKESIHLSLKGDEQGRMQLGELKDIAWIEAQCAEGTSQMWILPDDKTSRVSVLHMNRDGVLRIPIMETGDVPLQKLASLLETRAGVFVRDCNDAITREGGYLVIRSLEPGDYSLMTKPDGYIASIRVTDGDLVGSQIVGDSRVLEQKAAHPLQLGHVQVDDKHLRVTVAHTVPGTRVHVMMSRYITGDLFSALGSPSFRAPAGMRFTSPLSNYVSERQLGDEARYVMERRSDNIFPGNMLTRPSLILNPWSPRETDTGTDSAAEGGEYANLGGSFGGEGLAGRRDMGLFAEAEGGKAFSTYDFLEEVSPVVLGLIPDKNGVVRVPVESLPRGQQLHIYAVNDRSAVYRTLALKERSESTRDLRLTRYLLPDKHFTEQKRTTIVSKGEAFKVSDILSSKIEVVDSIPAAYRLLTALNDDPTLAEFNFLLSWPTTSPEKKRELYKKYACHELHIFLAKKDPEFFKAVVEPYLANKKDTTFVDNRLLGRSLDEYLSPWAYNRLNMVERAMLAQQLTSEQKSTARHLKDLYDLIPPDPAKYDNLFYGVLRSSGLEGNVALDMVMEEANVAANEPFAAPATVDGRMANGGSFGAVLPRSSAAKAKNGRLEDKSESLLLAAEVARDMPAPQAERQLAAQAAKKLNEARKRDVALRKEVRQFYRKLEKTREWVEQNYYRRPITDQVSELVTINAFWKDYAAWDGESPFLSGNLAEASGNFTEMILALAVLDLPFEAGEHNYAYADGGLTFTAGSDAIIYHKQVLPASGGDDSVLLVNQSFFANDDRYRYENSEQFDKFVTGAFERGRVYGCRLVLTNPTSARRKVDILHQVPAGAMPVNAGMQTRSMHAVLEPYSTQSTEYYFYFPAVGEFPHFPVHVAQNEEVVAAAEPFVFNVVEKVNEIDEESWDHISQFGSAEQVLNFLSTHNINRLDLNLIAWRVRDADFFGKALKLLEDRKVYNAVLWSYSVHHRDVGRMNEYFPHTALATQSGRIIESPLLTIDPVIRYVYEHKEYWPLVNARIFKLGGQRKILNHAFYQQYEAFMKLLIYRASLTQDDLMSVVIYMLLQDRVEEAMKAFESIDRSQLTMHIQYDYMAAYMAFYREQPDAARKIAKQYQDYPVERWHKLFADVLAQCDEIDGKASSVVDKEDRAQVQTSLAETEPRLDLEIEDNTLQVEHANLDACIVNFYPMDIELLFSRKPFVQDVGDRFTVVKPHRSEQVKLGRDGTEKLRVPSNLKGQNLMVEVTAAGISRMQAYYPNELKVDVVENYGQLRVADKKSGKALSKVYVKVYARTGDGSVRFFKDGYTDLRGRFDYTSLNTNEIDSVGRFAILIMSDTHGALVREAAPPKQ